MALDALVYTVPEAAHALQVSETQVRRMVANGTIQTVPGVGKRTLISRAWLAHWVETAGTDSERPNERTDGLPGGQHGRGTAAAVSSAPEERPGSDARSASQRRVS